MVFYDYYFTDQILKSSDDKNEEILKIFYDNSYFTGLLKFFRKLSTKKLF